MTDVEDVPSCAAVASPSFASLQQNLEASPLTRATGLRGGELLRPLGAGAHGRSKRAEDRPGMADVLAPPPHERPSGVDPGITVSGGLGGIRAQLDDLTRVAGMLAAQAEDLDAVAEQAVGIARDAESWSLRIQDRREALRPAGAEVVAAPHADQALGAFRARLGALLFDADRCAARAAALARDVEDVAEALGGARKAYEKAEKLAEGIMLSPENGFVRGMASSMPGGNFGLGAGIGAMWLWSNAVDKAAGTVGWDTDVRGALPDSQELFASMLDHFERAVLGPLALGTDSRGSVARSGGVAAKLLDRGGRLQHDAEVTRHAQGDFIPPARDLAEAAAALRAVGQAPPGSVGVQQVRRADGTSAWTVYVPGTQADFLERAGHGRDWFSAEAIAAGRDLAASKAPLLALRKAGARPGDTVSFVGHSQGGTIAKQAGANPEVHRRYEVGSVLAFAAPDPANVPTDAPGVNAIDVWNTADVVPMLDGRQPGAGPDHVHVAIDDAQLGDESLRSRSSDQSGRHSMGTLVEASALAARSQDPSLRRAAARLAEDLTGAPAGPAAAASSALHDQVGGGIQIYTVQAR